MSTDKIYKLMLGAGAVMLCLIISFAVNDTPSIFSKDAPERPVVAVSQTRSVTESASNTSREESAVLSEDFSSSEIKQSSTARKSTKKETSSKSSGKAEPSSEVKEKAPSDAEEQLSSHEEEPEPLWEDINLVTKEQLLTIDGLSEKAIDAFLEFRENIKEISNVNYLIYVREMSNKERELLLLHVYISEEESSPR